MNIWTFFANIIPILPLLSVHFFCNVDDVKIVRNVVWQVHGPSDYNFKTAIATTWFSNQCPNQLGLFTLLIYDELTTCRLISFWQNAQIPPNDQILLFLSFYVFITPTWYISFLSLCWSWRSYCRRHIRIGYKEYVPSRYIHSLGNHSKRSLKLL